MEKYNKILKEYKTLATCPTSAKNVGETVRLSVTITQGVSPYTITYKKDGTQLDIPVEVPTIGTYYYNYITVIGDEGTPTFSAEVVDSCITPQTWSDQCIVTVVTCKDRVIAKIKELYGLKVSTLPVCDQLFDLADNEDDEINTTDAVRAGTMTEDECCVLMAKYNTCLTSPTCTTPLCTFNVD